MARVAPERARCPVVVPGVRVRHVGVPQGRAISDNAADAQERRCRIFIPSPTRASRAITQSGNSGPNQPIGTIAHAAAAGDNSATSHPLPTDDTADDNQAHRFSPTLR